MRANAMGLVIAAGLAGSVAAQGGAPLRPGDLLFNGADQQVKVLQCRAVVYGRECETVLWANGAAASNPSWWDEAMLVKGDARVRAALRMPARGGAGAAASPATPRAAAPAAASARPATGTRVPDGRYACQLWMGSSYVNLGTVRSVGGVLTPNPLAKVGATVTGVAPSKNGITVSYTTARGYRESMDCTRG